MKWRSEVLAYLTNGTVDGFNGNVPDPLWLVLVIIAGLFANLDLSNFR